MVYLHLREEHWIVLNDREVYEVTHRNFQSLFCLFEERGL